MPTAYTAALCEGKDPTLTEYALLCARAFSACVHMRDAPLDTPIPDTIEPDSYYKDQRDTSAEMLTQVLDMNEDECAEHAAHDYFKERKYLKETIEARQKLEKRITRMFEQLNAWRVPPELAELEKLMRDQLLSARTHDADTTWPRNRLKDLKPEAGDEWRARRIQELNRQIEFYSTLHNKSVEQARKATAWLTTLRESLAAVDN